MVKKNKHKKGIAMIELIFALVIMGIVLMSAPMLIQQSIKSANVALQQEAISAAAAQTSIILSMHWDEENSDLPAGVSPILETNRTNLDFNTTAPRGLIGVASRNSKKDSNTTLKPTLFASFGTDTNETDNTQFDDVDDYDGSDFGLMVFNNETITVDIGEYVDVNLSIKTHVNYAQDIAPVWGTDINVTDTTTHKSVITQAVTTTPTNIKFIRVNLTSNTAEHQNIKELEKNITMEAFSCNLGTFSIAGVEL